MGAFYSDQSSAGENSEENTISTIDQLSRERVNKQKISISSTSRSHSFSTALAQSAYTPSFSSSSSSSFLSSPSSVQPINRMKRGRRKEEESLSKKKKKKPGKDEIIKEEKNLNIINKALRQNRKCALCRCIVKDAPVVASVHFRSQLCDSLLHLTAEDKAEYRKEEELRAASASKTSLLWDKEWKNLFPPSRPPNYDDGIPMCPWCGYELERGSQCQNQNRCGPIEWEEDVAEPRFDLGLRSVDDDVDDEDEDESEEVEDVAEVDDVDDVDDGAEEYEYDYEDNLASLLGWSDSRYARDGSEEDELDEKEEHVSQSEEELPADVEESKEDRKEEDRGGRVELVDDDYDSIRRSLLEEVTPISSSLSSSSSSSSSPSYNSRIHTPPRSHNRSRFRIVEEELEELVEDEIESQNEPNEDLNSEEREEVVRYAERSVAELGLHWSDDENEYTQNRREDEQHGEEEIPGEDDDASNEMSYQSSDDTPFSQEEEEVDREEPEQELNEDPENVD